MSATAITLARDVSGCHQGCVDSPSQTSLQSFTPLRDLDLTEKPGAIARVPQLINLSLPDASDCTEARRVDHPTGGSAHLPRFPLMRSHTTGQNGSRGHLSTASLAASAETADAPPMLLYVHPA
jgi:hypothetical protein